MLSLNQNGCAWCFSWLIIAAACLILPSSLMAKIRCSQSALCIETIKTDNVIQFHAINKKFYKISMRIDVTKTNMESDTFFPATFVLDGHEKRLLFALRFGREKWQYRYRYDWIIGDIGAEHEDYYVYRLPYLRGNRFRITQSCNGSFTHFGRSQYAIDFGMPVGTPVCAARDGLVVDTKDDSDLGGDSKDYLKHTNFIIIEHYDGTIGEYHHLMLNGVLVYPGDYVQKGQIIGYSGNTGYTRGPHLHFVVYSARDVYSRISLPVQFSTQSGIVKCPEKNVYYAVD